jgi:hypothetical protein
LFVYNELGTFLIAGMSIRNAALQSGERRKASPRESLVSYIKQTAAQSPKFFCATAPPVPMPIEKWLLSPGVAISFESQVFKERSALVQSADDFIVATTLADWRVRVKLVASTGQSGYRTARQGSGASELVK